MTKDMIYKHVTWAKEQMKELSSIPLKGTDETFDWFHAVASGERLPGEIMILWPRCTWGQKMALLTVLCTGHFLQDDCFMMPSTKECMDNYKKIVHAYKHGRRLTIYVYGKEYWGDEYCYRNPDYRIDVRTDRLELFYSRAFYVNYEEW